MPRPIPEYGRGTSRKGGGFRSVPPPAGVPGGRGRPASKVASMQRTTPPRPLDVEALFPELAAYRGTTTRLHPPAGQAGCHGRFRGRPPAVAGGRALAGVRRGP
ncbi:hypothetical protein GCM10010300_60490 [Streptomyces olivaceoviridis]|nr:hypothetical protein GCM10010300_60490 [Streptomyces olivaceoviridis]